MSDNALLIDGDRNHSRPTDSVKNVVLRTYQ